ncbi:16S rRNA (adenine(1518)-N(6)/adenine(1519)-N(6))-dimethyltransferase RsmA [Pontibacter sp. SGAir0037]|uniref:16S rRNA (adenine(1518)-N(6)/adenine(1519)-N(6))- dimethyltransferase RsmA n=1 Tax=Pontibacter sp. SGAir0037 TaxID=2571030 RepID=UPI0010CCE305|nr:16S rRNA (adenine(1518)-N(6)/adenine(1519)-N(6))-dimethyltransferase RsmA [Pontibacter sp. SGAir0037]QCR22634.1 16S rRNA (adenine(1518)-N(6)/adenine(1519)-N(6))-dimethyltransferase [Pontibacter sp. SGAir0037]
MSKVSPKKHLGQHFLVDQNIAIKIVEQLTLPHGVKDVLEIGPGMGVLTQYLLQHPGYTTTVVDIDRESIAYLKEHFPALEDRIISADFLKTDLSQLFPDKFAIIGNFPYNISSQIFFKVLEYRDRVPEVVCMIQKEVAERLAAPPGSKAYGILSVLLQAWYNIDYKFTVHEHVFHPPPKVKSGVISLVRNEVEILPCDEKRFFEVVKLSFGTRRKTLRNCLKSYNLPSEVTAQPVFDKRAEQLSVQDFIELTQLIEQHI